MWRHGFILWFTLTALLGPGVCYRALAVSMARAGEPAPPAEREAADKSVATAASDDAPAGDGSPVCPPGQGKHAKALPPNAATNLAAELQATGAVFVPPATVLAQPPNGQPAGPGFCHRPPLAGRDLLAAYCLLRC